jgi:hypothetical protein
MTLTSCLSDMLGCMRMIQLPFISYTLGYQLCLISMLLRTLETMGNGRPN